MPVRVDVWEGFIFINLAENPAEELETYMGQFGRELAGYPFHEFTSCYQYLVTVRANWKVVLDAFQESYHAPFLHHASGDSLAGGDNPFLHALDISLFDRHRSMSVPRTPRHEPTELEAMSARFGAFMYSARSAGGPDTSRMPAGVNRTRSDRWLFDINVIFPTFFCDVANGNYFTYNFWPISRNETFWDVRMYYRPARSAREWISQEYSKVRLRDTLFEDLDTVEATQRGLESSGRDYIYIQDQEITIRHGHKVVEDHVRFYGDGK